MKSMNLKKNKCKTLTHLQIADKRWRYAHLLDRQLRVLTLRTGRILRSAGKFTRLIRTDIVNLKLMHIPLHACAHIAK